MKISDLGKREIAIIYILASLIFAAIFYYTIVSPELGRYRSAVAEYNSQQQREMRQTMQRDTLLNEYLTLREKSDNVKKLIFTKREAELFFEMLPVISKKTGNHLSSITPGDSSPLAQPNPEEAGKKDAAPSPLAEIAQIPVNLTIEGKYGNMITLFNAYEEYKQLMSINNVGVRPGRENEVGVSFFLNLLHTKSAMKAPDERLAAITAEAQLAKAGEIAKEIGEQRAKEVALKGKKDEADSKIDKLVNLLTNVLPFRGKPPEPRKTELKTTPRQAPELEIRDAVKADTQYYTVQVNAYNIEENKKELENFLKSRKYEPWVGTELLTGAAPYPLLAGKFKTEKEAEQVGKLLQKEISWIKEYDIKLAEFDSDAVLKRTRNLPGKVRD